MRLSEINEYLGSVVGLFSIEEGLAIGQTIETDRFRIHRFGGSIRVTDLANAGKRGKMVDEFALYDIDYVRDSKILRLIEQFAKVVHRAKSYKMALKMAEGIVSEADRLGVLGSPKIEKHQYKGVRVAAPGFKPIVINTPYISVNADSDHFSVRDNVDRNNEPTLIAPTRGKVTAIKKFHEWARKNRRKLERMTFSEVSGALRKAGIDTHYFCAMD